MNFCWSSIAHSFHCSIVSYQVLDMNWSFLYVNFKSINLFFQIKDGISIDITFNSKIRLNSTFVIFKSVLSHQLVRNICLIKPQLNHLISSNLLQAASIHKLIFLINLLKYLSVHFKSELLDEPLLQYQCNQGIYCTFLKSYLSLTYSYFIYN